MSVIEQRLEMRRFPTYRAWTNKITNHNRMCKELPGLGCKPVPVESRMWYAYYWLRFMLGIDHYRISTGSMRTVDTASYAMYKYISRKKIYLSWRTFTSWRWQYRLWWVKSWFKHQCHLCERRCYFCMVEND